MPKNETRPYRLREGAKHSRRDPESGRTIKCKAGDIVQLTEKQARAWNDLFDPVDGGFEGAPAAPAPAAPAAPPAPDEDPESEAPEEPDTPTEPADTAKNLIAQIKAAETADEVRAIADAEAALPEDKQRSSVLEAADRKLDQLEGEE